MKWVAKTVSGTRTEIIEAGSYAEAMMLAARMFGSAPLDVRLASDVPQRIQAVYDGNVALPNDIQTYFHCSRCLQEMPVGVTPKDWSRTQIGITSTGQFQVWCNRHDLNVTSIKLQLTRL